MDVSRWPDVVDALVTQTRALSGYRSPVAGAAASLIPVFDGPTYGLTADHAGSFLAWGVAGDPNSPSDAGDIAWRVATTGNATRDESALIRARIVAQTGETDPTNFSTLTRSAFRILGDVMGLLKTNPTMGLVAQRILVQFDRIESLQRYVSRGPVVKLEFSVKYDTRIVI